MFDDQERQAQDAESPKLSERQALKRGSGNEAGGGTAFGQLDGVVETPRRAGASIRRAGEDHVTLLRQFLQNLPRGR